MKKETVKKAEKKIVKKSVTKAATKIEKVTEKVAEKITDKKASKINPLIKWIDLGLLILGVVLVIIGIFVPKIGVAFKVIGALIIAGMGITYAIKSKNHVLIKSVGVLALIALLLTWLLPNGAYSGETFAENGMLRVGLNDLPTTVYYAIYFAMDKLMYLFILAGFYGVLSRTNGYKKLINDIADYLEDYKKLFAVITLVVFILLTSLFSQSLAVVAFIPFFISILSKLKIDKLTAFVVTFGGMLVGLLGAPWGTEGLYWFNYYAGTTLSDGFTLRLIIECCIGVIFVLFTLLHLNKELKKDSNEKIINDPFEIGEPDKKVKKYPVVIVLVITTIMVILGYVNWETNFGVTIFNDFHTWLTGLTIGEDCTIFAFVLGKAASAFGSWDIATFVSLLLVSIIVISLIERVKLTDFLTNFGEGFKKCLQPILLFVSVFVIFVIAYTSPFIPTITNWVLSLTDKFNPYLTSIMAFITSIFHADLGYTGYSVGGYLASAYADKLSIAHTIYFSMYGLVQLIIPSSGLLLLGLSYTKVEYKSWLKYIWKFAVVIFVLLLIIFTIATYA